MNTMSKGRLFPGSTGRVLCGTWVHIPMPVVEGEIGETACKQQSLQPLHANVPVSIQEFQTGNQFPLSSLCWCEDACGTAAPKGRNSNDFRQVPPEDRSSTRLQLKVCPNLSHAGSWDVAKALPSGMQGITVYKAPNFGGVHNCKKLHS